MGARAKRDERLLPRPEETAKVINDEGWFNTQDLARMEDETESL